MRRALVVALGAALLSACSAEPAARPEAQVSEEASPTPATSDAAIIEPAVQVGDSIGPLQVVAADLREVPGRPGEWVGTVGFRGSIQLSGLRGPHPADPDYQAVCFFPDAASARRLPRLKGDERISWFCFPEGDAAAPELDASAPQLVTIGEFTYHFSFSDVFNTAHLVSIDGPVTGG